MDLALFITILSFILALAFGSFTNVLIYRGPEAELGINSPRHSFCPSCKKQLRFWDNIPVLSYIMLGGKCRYCQAKISLQYPIVEILVALAASPFILKLVYEPLQEFQKHLFIDHDLVQFSFQELALLFNYYALQIIFVLIFISFAIALGFVDQKLHQLPHKLTYSAILLALLNSVLFGDILFSVASLGMIFFIFDSLTHFVNKFCYKKDALEIVPAALVFRSDDLAKHINLIYLFYITLSLYLFLNSQLAILEIIFSVIGGLYILNDIFLDFFNLPVKKRESLYKETKEEARKKTVMGGGDAAMLAFIAAIFYIQDALLILICAFYIALIYVALKKLYLFILKLLGIKGLEDMIKDNRVPLGASLAVSLIAAMILRVILAV